jgi:hypothetical protein
VVKPCTVCGTEKGAINRRTKSPQRNADGWCLACVTRKGKPRIVEPCVDCGDPGGRTQVKGGKRYIIRVLGRCGSCSGRYYARIAASKAKKDKKVVVRAKPCFSCGRTTGSVDTRNGKVRRVHGLCLTCYRKVGPEEAKRIEHRIRFQSVNKNGPIGANNPPTPDLIKEWGGEIYRSTHGHALVPDRNYVEQLKEQLKARELTEEQKRKRSDSWVKEILAAERALSRLVRQWAIRETKKEADQATLEPSLLPSLLAS